MIIHSIRQVNGRFGFYCENKECVDGKGSGVERGDS